MTDPVLSVHPCPHPDCTAVLRLWAEPWEPAHLRCVCNACRLALTWDGDKPTLTLLAERPLT